MTNMETNLPYLARDKDRHGNPRIYVRRNGKRVRIREQEGTLEFAKAYAKALEKLCGELPVRAAPLLTTHPKDTLGYMGAKYFASKEFEAIARKSQQARRSCLEECFKEPLSRPGSMMRALNRHSAKATPAPQRKRAKAYQDHSVIKAVLPNR